MTLKPKAQDQQSNFGNDGIVEMTDDSMRSKTPDGFCFTDGTQIKEGMFAQVANTVDWDGRAKRGAVGKLKIRELNPGLYQLDIHFEDDWFWVPPENIIRTEGPATPRNEPKFDLQPRTEPKPKPKPKPRKKSTKIQRGLLTVKRRDKEDLGI